MNAFETVGSAPPHLPPSADRLRLQTHWRSLLVAFVVSFAVAGMGSWFTVLDAWYFALKQPAWKPPDPAFGAIWSAIFSLCAVSAWMGWHASQSRNERLQWLALWALNAFCNVFWSVIYFKWHRPDWSLVGLLFLWQSIFILIVFIYPRRRLAAWLIVPYGVWVTTAGLLNLATLSLNGPFA